MARLDEPLTGPGAAAAGWPVDLTRGVVQVRAGDGRTVGAGFLVGERLAVTCAHVLADGVQGPPTGPVSVVFAQLGGVVRTVRVDPQGWRDPEDGDIAFLRFDEPPPPQARPLPLGRASGVRGHRVKTFGFPGNVLDAGHYGYGVAGDQVVDDGGAPLLQVTDCTEVTEGFSGGPVLDEHTGLVIGMVHAVTRPDRLDRGRATAFITPTETLREGCGELSVEPVCPYRGLEPFTSADAGWFHGRDRAVQAVLASLRRDRRFLALLGPSGAGKSSLLHAGVLPALAEGALPGSDRWGVLSSRPGADPFAQLAQAGLAEPGRGLGTAAHRWLQTHPERERLVLVVDQFEELLVTTAPALRAAFLQELVSLTEQEPALTVIMGLRDDFYGRLAAAAPGLMRLVGHATVNVPAGLEAGELAAIIQRPAAAAGRSLEPSLAERIARDAMAAAPSTTEAGGAAITVLPLLEFALTELWHRHRDGRLTHHSYDQIGGVVGGLTRWCDQAYQALPPAQRPLVRRIVTSLVTPGDEVANIPPTRHRRTLDQLRAETAGPRQEANSTVDTVVAALAGQRLLVTSRDPSTDEAVVELVHETLIREWGLLRQWLSDDHDFLVWRKDLETDYTQWAANKRDSELLLRGSALEQARSWPDRRPGELRTDLVEFISLSHRNQHQRLTRDRRRVQLLAVLLVIALGLGALSAIQTNRAQQQANRAQQQAQLATSRSIAAQADRLAERQPDLAQLLSLASLHTAATPEAWASIQTTLSRPLHLSHQLTGHTDLVWDAAFSPDGTMLATASADQSVRLWDVATHQPVGEPLTGHSNWVYGVEFSPDGTLLATASADGTAQVWDVATRQPLGEPLTGHTDAVWDVAFSPDGTMLATASADQSVRLWDVATHQPLGEPLTGHTKAVNAVTFSPDGTLLATASDDGTAQVWDVAGHQPLGEPLTAHTDAVWDVAFSPDGHLLATASADGTARIWDVATHQPLGRPLTGHTNAVYDVAFSPDSTLLATASADGTARIWDVAGRRPLGEPLAGHTNWVYGVTFSPDGTLLATASFDGTARIWEVTGHQPLGEPLTGHTKAVNDVAFSPDGAQLATASGDLTARVWAVAGHQPLGEPLTGHTNAVNAVAFSPDGTLLATASFDGTARIWDVATHQPVGEPLTGHTDWVLSVAFSPDGTLLATAGYDGTARIWDVATHQPRGEPLTGHAKAIWDVAFSPDGRLLATASSDLTARVWDVAGHQPVGEPLTGHTNEVYGVTFSPDGTLLATASADGTARVWDAATHQPRGEPLTGHTNAVRDVVFSPDGTLLATASDDRTARIWDAATHRPLSEPLTGHTDWVYGVEFSPDGTLLATASDDGSARLWATSGTWVRHSCELVGRNLSQEEWDRYVGTVTPYVRLCAQYPSGPGADPGAPDAVYPESP